MDKVFHVKMFASPTYGRNVPHLPLTPGVATATDCLFNRAEIGYPKLLKFQDIAMGRFTSAGRLAPPYPIGLCCTNYCTLRGKQLSVDNDGHF